MEPKWEGPKMEEPRRRRVEGVKPKWEGPKRREGPKRKASKFDG